MELCALFFNALSSWFNVNLKALEVRLTLRGI